MDPRTLIEHLFKHSGQLHPEYTSDQHKIWVMGFLACIAVEKNNNDNILWAKIKTRLDELHNPSPQPPAIIRTKERVR